LPAENAKVAAKSGQNMVEFAARSLKQAWQRQLQTKWAVALPNGA
jgi:hypothetical protein